MKRTTLLTATLAVIAAGSIAAAPMRDRAGAREPAEARLEHMSEVLDLSDTQRQQADAILAEVHALAESEHQAMREQREQLKALLDAGSAAPAEVGELVIDLHQRRQAMRQRHDQVRSEIRSLLTPEQQEKMDLIEELRAERREHRRHTRHGQGRRGHHLERDPAEDTLPLD